MIPVDRRTRLSTGWIVILPEDFTPVAEPGPMEPEAICSGAIDEAASGERPVTNRHVARLLL